MIKRGFIQYVKGKHQFNQKIFRLTPKGIKKSKEVIKKKSKEFPEEFDNLISAWKGRWLEYSK